MSGYTQLTREQRYQIHALVKTGQNQTQMAMVVGVHKATIRRELRRNRGLCGYRPHQAHRLAQARQGPKRRACLAQTTWQQVETLVREVWRPEQIHGRLFYSANTVRRSVLNGYISIPIRINKRGAISTAPAVSENAAEALWPL